ncbi:MAG: histidine phosphatase family protein, partial [Chloroflexota bacterium]|nr:histidine phosphatase family protein [Chloroflexota bacterium]
AVYCSPLRRARQTADEVARVHDLEAIPEDGLMELDAGELDGMSFEEAMSSYSEFFKEWAAKGSSVRLPGGESMDGLGERTWSAVERLLERHPDETVIAVSHSLAIQSVVSRALGMDSSSRRRLWLDLASVSILDFGGRGASLLLYNDTCHLRMGA